MRWFAERLNTYTKSALFATSKRSIWAPDSGRSSNCAHPATLIKAGVGCRAAATREKSKFGLARVRAAVRTGGPAKRGLVKVAPVESARTSSGAASRRRPLRALGSCRECPRVAVRHPASRSALPAEPPIPLIGPATLGETPIDSALLASLRRAP